MTLITLGVIKWLSWNNFLKNSGSIIWPPCSQCFSLLAWIQWLLGPRQLGPDHWAQTTGLTDNWARDYWARDNWAHGQLGSWTTGPVTIGLRTTGLGDIAQQGVKNDFFFLITLITLHYTIFLWLNEVSVLFLNLFFSKGHILESYFFKFNYTQISSSYWIPLRFLF